ncbi:polysaccharide pyruvyl transferase family protein [Halomonas kalidii]|uniref:Polysaccharide pyruvyl transferase family protein n=1 Tax=Halomonas kalidii TaxID=3043293 RepID=A0ABT6VLJ8_9GAMM|nr:polysaccharide pyruvyl transferase family protein [Halomonas kalidii]MDI5934157.1 polysaccharide pyruvyl transferase family protein [Halomonas kalidii]
MPEVQQQTVKVCLVNDTSNTCNWGAKATSTALRELIHDVGGSLTTTFYESRLDARHREDHRILSRLAHGCDRFLTVGPGSRRINNSLFHRLARRCPDVAPERWEDFGRKAQRVMACKALDDIRVSLEESDLVIISGEGCVYGNIRQSRMLFFIAYLAKHCLGKDTAMVNHSADLRHPVLARIAREVYPLLDDVVFREADSAHRCREFCRPVVGADAAYLYSPAPVETWCRTGGRPDEVGSRPSQAVHLDPGRPYLCIGGSSSYLRRGGSVATPAAGYLALCRNLQTECEQLVLVAASWQDQRIFQPVAAELGLPLIGIDATFQHAIDVIGNARAYIGGRWHSGIFAHTGGTPVVALGAYTPKMQALLNHIGLDGEPFDPFDLAEQAPRIAARVRDCLSQGDRLRATLQEGARECAHRARLNVCRVQRRAGTSAINQESP